ncbi:uncharacterized protein LOC110418080 [Herrania umbratica]|uniref:Uncharacterized protein LOC110418080 n=1 Tax=Herrania umbratica TaxID=108875 RepID=A0A6J1AHR5_9ROSI|nr:uncharacterized protein LOC110418080 [Herrania umbratica]
MAKQEQSRALRDIHRIESSMFWIERLALLPLASQFPYFQQRLVLEPDIIFYIHRPVILTLILNHVLPNGCFIAAIIAWLVFIGTGYYDYKKELDKESRKNSSLSSKTNSPIAMEPSKDGKTLKKEEVMSAMTRKFHKWFIAVISKLDTMLKEFAERPKGFHKWFYDTLSEWDTMLKEVAGHGQELKTAEDKSDEQQDRGSEDSDFEKIEDAMKD